jgi:hypothetical protein
MTNHFYGALFSAFRKYLNATLEKFEQSLESVRESDELRKLTLLAPRCGDRPLGEPALPDPGRVTSFPASIWAK